MKERPQDKVILTRLATGSGSSIATYWIAMECGRVLGGFWGSSCTKARNALRNLERRGLVKGHGYRDQPPIRWWTITDAGRAWLQAREAIEALNAIPVNTSGAPV